MSKKNIRKAMRSGQYVCPICNKRVPLVEHHIHGRDVDRWREAWNSLFLCPTCHDFVHKGEIIIIGWYKMTSGRELMWYRKGETPPDPHVFPPAIPHIYGVK